MPLLANIDKWQLLWQGPREAPGLAERGAFIKDSKFSNTLK